MNPGKTPRELRIGPARPVPPLFGADLEQAMQGEDPSSATLVEARRWIAVYHQLVNLEEQLLDTLARVIPAMPSEAQKEAERTNLPVIVSQVERYRHRLALWKQRRDELERGRLKP